MGSAFGEQVEVPHGWSKSVLDLVHGSRGHERLRVDTPLQHQLSAQRDHVPHLGSESLQGLHHEGGDLAGLRPEDAQGSDGATREYLNGHSRVEADSNVPDK